MAESRAWSVRKQLLVGVPVLVACSVAVAKLPPWLVKNGDTAMRECLKGSDVMSCDFGLGFRIGAVFPHARSAARAHRESLDELRAERMFDAAMTAHPDPARRDQAATTFLAANKNPRAALARIEMEGALGAMANVDLDVAWGVHRPAFAALALGDVAKARMRLAHGHPLPTREAARTGALACLLGDRKRGIEFLRATDRNTTYAEPLAAFAALHCGATFADVGFEPNAMSNVYTVEGYISRAFDPAFQRGRRQSLGWMLLDKTTIWRTGAVGRLALVAGDEREPSPRELFDALHVSSAARDLPEQFATTPWTAQRGEAGGMFADYVPPDWVRLAARRYAAAAKLATTTLDNDKEVLERYATTPSAELHDMAVTLYLHAAGYQLRRGDREGARATLAEARTLEPATLARAPLELAAGDPAAALATVAASEAAHPGENPLATVTRVLALARQGDHANAHTLARNLHGEVEDWLVLATGITSGARLEDLSLAESKWGLSARDVRDAIVHRTALAKDYIAADNTVVLPALLVAIAAAAEAHGDNPDVVIDRLFDSMQPSRTFAFARAEAARWRKQTATADLWQARGETIERLFVDDRAVMLAGIAGLW